MTDFLNPGFHIDCTASRYHADPCERPSLSSSLAAVLYGQTPLRAFLEHPRLNKHWVEEYDSKFDLGSAVHDTLSSGGRRVQIVAGFPDYKTAKAREMRDKIRAEGHVPLLDHQFEDVEKIVRQIIGTLDRLGITFGAQEAVFIAEDRGVLLRAMIDSFAPHWINDFKVSGINLANDFGLGNHIAETHYDLRAAFYMRVAELVFPNWAGRMKYRWIFCEDKPPFGVRIVEASATQLEMGGRKMRHAMGVWQQCLASGIWPHLEGLPRQVPYPPHKERDVLERETTEGFVMGPTEMLKRMDDGEL